MSKNCEQLSIANKRYSFKKGYLQVSLANKDEVRDELMRILKIAGKTYFSVLLNGGIIDIARCKYEDITTLFEKYGISEVWDITE